MTEYFLFGSLCHGPLRSVVLGRDVSSVSATLAGYALCWPGDGARAQIAPAKGALVQGLLLRDVTLAEAARLAFHCGGPLTRRETVALQDGQTVQAQLCGDDPTPLPDPADPAPSGPIADFGTWQTVWADVAVATARDVMALADSHPAAAVRARLHNMRVRSASRLRAATPTPATRRLNTRPQDVLIEDRATPYAQFFAVEEYRLRHRRFDGSLSPAIDRAVFISGDAVTVLPYDARRDRVLLIEQFRAGPLARGDAQCWSLETIAGRVDPDETPEQAARREAIEEAGLTLDVLLPVANYYPTIGAKSEYLYSYIALVDLPDGIAGVFGLETEAEDIRGHLLDFAEMMTLIRSGEIANAPLILTAFWLQNERQRLRDTGQPA